MNTKRERILQAALSVFAENGYEKATLRKIADRADIRSPGLIYWYFPNKKALFQSVLTEVVPLEAAIEVLKRATAGAAESRPRETLAAVGESFLTAMENETLGKLLRIVVADVIRRPEVLDEFANRVLVQAISALTAYLKSETEAGNLRPHDPLVVARVFFSGLVLYAIHREFIPSLRQTLPEPHTFLEEMLDVLFEGIAAERGGTQARSGSAATQETSEKPPARGGRP